MLNKLITVYGNNYVAGTVDTLFNEVYLGAEQFTLIPANRLVDKENVLT